MEVIAVWCIEVKRDRVNMAWTRISRIYLQPLPSRFTNRAIIVHKKATACDEVKGGLLRIPSQGSKLTGDTCYFILLLVTPIPVEISNTDINEQAFSGLCDVMLNMAV